MDINGKRWSAHRLSYRIHVGIIPDGLFVCHHCDNRLCVRPEHLFVGTAFDNVHDMIRKGRDDRRNGRGGACGSKHGLARLTECQVVEMRRAYALGEGSYGTLAMRFGVHTKTVAGIIQGKEWKHILPG